MDENLRTFLQHHSNMKYSLFLKKLKQSIYTPIAQLNAFVHKSTEPLCFEDMKNERFDNIKIGDSWGGFFDCAWFKFTADIENMQKNLVAVIDVGGEGCIYNKDGEVIQGITNVLGMVDNFQTVKGKAVIPLDRIDTFKDGKVLFYADCGNNGRGGKSSGQARFKRADICVFRQDILDLYYDILACYQLLSAVNDNAQKREIKAHINKAISLAHNTDSQSVLNARNALSKMFDGKYKQNFTVYAVGHGHLDLAWLWPVRETKRKAIRTFSNAVYESEQCPSYVFNGSQPQQYEFIKEISPEFFERIKQSVQRGNIEPQGGMWAESDTNLPCGESLIRQCFYGKKYFREEFQKDVKTLWLPDVFGYTAALPQIIKKCGMDTFMTIKLSWNNINDFPHHTFIWNGLDDSKVLVHMPPEGDYNSNATPYAFEKTYQKYKEKQVSDIALMSFGIGDGGGGPGEYHINMVKRCENLRYIPNVKMSSSESFFDKLKKDVSNYPEYKGELYLEKHQGTYTTQGKVKKNNRECERLLHFAEWICTMNHGELPKYYVENSNPPIVSREIYQAVQTLQNSRKNVYSNSKGKYLLSKVMRCPDCGMTFRRQIVKGTAYWLCSNKAASMTDCRPLRLKETAVYETFTMLVQKLTDNRKTLLGDLIRQVEAMQNRTSDNIDVIRRIDKKIADLAAQNLVIARLHTNGVINSAEFSAQSSEINNKISTLRTKRRKKLSDDENDAWFDTLNSLNEILEAYDPSNNFDEELFEKIVVGITVNSNADLTFKLIGDIELTEEIPLKGRCRRRENS